MKVDELIRELQKYPALGKAQELLQSGRSLDTALGVVAVNETAVAMTKTAFALADVPIPKIAVTNSLSVAAETIVSMVSSIKDTRLRAGLVKPSRVVVLGNPPYSEGNDHKSRTLYQHFFNAAKTAGADEIILVIPARWYAGGKGLSGFRKEMLTSGRLKQLRDFENSRNVFPTVNISGGVCFIHWVRDFYGNCRYVDSNGTASLRQLAEFDVFVRSERGIPILRKVLNKSKRFLSEVTLPKNPFGITNVQLSSIPYGSNLVPCLARKDRGMILVPGDAITSNSVIAGKYKVALSSGLPGGGWQHADGSHPMRGKLEVLPPGTVCTDTFLVTAATQYREEAVNAAFYLNQRFPRFMEWLRARCLDRTATSFSWVPLMDFSQAWDDAALYTYFALEPEEIQYIESTISAPRRELSEPRQATSHSNSGGSIHAGQDRQADAGCA